MSAHRIRVTDHSGRGRSGTSGLRGQKIRAFLATLSPEQVRALISALTHSENAAGDWLEAHGQPRTWRKNMRIEKAE